MSGAVADENLSVPKLFTLGIQHVLVLYAGAVAVPLIIGRALKLQPEEVAFLISADLFACGMATLVQSVGFPGVGIRQPPDYLHPLLESGILLAAIVSVLLNQFFNGFGSASEARSDAVAAGRVGGACVGRAR